MVYIKHFDTLLLYMGFIANICKTFPNISFKCLQTLKKVYWADFKLLTLHDSAMTETFYPLFLLYLDFLHYMIEMALLFHLI